MFKKSDLKNGDVCVTASNRVIIAMTEMKSFAFGGSYYAYYGWYTDDLKSKIDMNENINKIYRPNNLEQLSFNPAIYEKGTLVYDRETEEKKPDKPTFEIGRLYQVGKLNATNRTGNAIKITGKYTEHGDTYYSYKTISGSDTCSSFCDNSIFAKSLIPPKRYTSPVTDKPAETSKTEKTISEKHIKVVFVTQNDKDYLFEVPSDLDLKKGDKVLCKTMRGLQEGICRMNSTEITEVGLSALVKMCGAYLPLKKVVDKVVEFYPNPSLDMAKVKYIQSEGVLYKVEKVKE